MVAMEAMAGTGMAEVMAAAGMDTAAATATSPMEDMAIIGMATNTGADTRIIESQKLKDQVATAAIRIGATIRIPRVTSRLWL